MARVIFYVNSEKPQAPAVCERLSAKAVALGLDVVAPDAAADVVIALGGDGTFLRAVHEFPGVPILGLNLGGLGYLSSVEVKDFDRALETLARGDYRISDRRMLAVNGRYSALNDIVITRESSGRSVRLDLEADGHKVTHYMADGLIFATPTGSTAYSLAAGGPVLMPDSESFVVTPMNPHALSVRALVVKDSVRFAVTARPRLAGNEMKLVVYADGENVMTLVAGDAVEVSMAACVAKLVELPGYDPYEVLSRKLGWSGSNVK